MASCPRKHVVTISMTIGLHNWPCRTNSIGRKQGCQAVLCRTARHPPGKWLTRWNSCSLANSCALKMWPQHTLHRLPLVTAHPASCMDHESMTWTDAHERDACAGQERSMQVSSSTPLPTAGFRKETLHPFLSGARIQGCTSSQVLHAAGMGTQHTLKAAFTGELAMPAYLTNMRTRMSGWSPAACLRSAGPAWVQASAHACEKHCCTHACLHDSVCDCIRISICKQACCTSMALF